jgi:hypothetical protein
LAGIGLSRAIRVLYRDASKTSNFFGIVSPIAPTFAKPRGYGGSGGISRRAKPGNFCKPGEMLSMTATRNPFVGGKHRGGFRHAATWNDR